MHSAHPVLGTSGISMATRPLELLIALKFIRKAARSTRLQLIHREVRVNVRKYRTVMVFLSYSFLLYLNKIQTLPTGEQEY